MPPDTGQDSNDPIRARAAALDVLAAVLDQRRSLTDALAQTRSFAILKGSDQTFASYLVRTTLRRLGELDALIDPCLERPLPGKAGRVRHVLRLGVIQLFFSETADHAAIDSSVDLCRKIGQVPYAKLVNAVLRRLQRETPSGVQNNPDAGRNTPDWLWDVWQAAYGPETAAAIADVHLQVPPLDLTVRPGIPPERVADKLDGTLILGGTVRLKGGDVTGLDGFDAGEWWVQDAAARLPALLLGDVAGQSVIDLCAAPGGKTLQLAAAGAQVTAVDISKKRLGRLHENLARLGLNAEVITADARKWRPATPADAVLVDAPCSATGTVRRHPDVVHLKSPSDVQKLTGVQDAVLDAAAEMIGDGGRLVYATCSLQPEEGSERIAAFLNRHADFTVVPVSPAEIGGWDDAITDEGFLRTLPSHLADQGGMDGFFAARLIKKAP